MIDQDQARKFWTNWVRREIGGNDMIQEAAVGAAVNELLLGHDNQAAADAARNTAHRLGGGVPTRHPDPPPQGGRLPPHRSLPPARSRPGSLGNLWPASSAARRPPRT